MVCFLEKNIWLDRSYDNSKASRFLALAAPNTTKPIGPIYFNSRWAAVDRLNGMLRVSLQRWVLWVNSVRREIVSRELHCDALKLHDAPTFKIAHTHIPFYLS